MRRLLPFLLVLGCAASSSTESTLTRAVRDGDAAAVRALCARGADPDQPSGGNGWSPLMHAVHKNQTGTAVALLDAGAHVDRAAPGGMTPLMMTAGYGNREMVALLLARGANPRVKDEDGATALDYALSGMTDLDAFTYFRCQSAAVALLAPQSPAPLVSSRRWASIKGCA